MYDTVRFRTENNPVCVFIAHQTDNSRQLFRIATVRPDITVLYIIYVQYFRK